MGLFSEIKNKYYEHIQERNNRCNNLIAYISQLINDRDSLLANEDEFIDVKTIDIWLSKHKELSIELATTKLLRLADNYKQLSETIVLFNEVAKTIKIDVRNHNESVSKKKLEKAYSIIGEVEGRRLDEQQMMCIIKESYNHLVVAGAGTGKTTTIIGKIKYMLNAKKIQPNEILVLSFTNASATEMRERIHKETGTKIMASTFHKLGLSIIAKVDGIMPKITKLNMRDFIKEQVKINSKDIKYLWLLVKYFDLKKGANVTEFDFKNQKEYEAYLRVNPPKTLNGEIVKSYGEMNIANFLKRNNVVYEYEREYEHDTRTEDRSQYYPDFYLPEYDLYIEYFGINRKGEVPAYFLSRSEKTASEEYNDSIRWKRELHKKNRTTLVECYAYENMEGILIENLSLKLQKYGVSLKPISEKDLWEQIILEDTNILDGLTELFETAITLLKSQNYSIEDLHNKNLKNDKTTDILIKLLEPIYTAYENYLSYIGEIDFNDMINKATEYVRNGMIVSPYKYVIVDEYQDMALARYNLLKTMRDSTDFELFCVGDDWQSIYRFAGSDIGLILNFEKYWGATEYSKIETTYRFSKSLIQVSGDFIMKNPRQLRKEIKGKSEEQGFALAEIKNKTDKAAVNDILDRLDELPENSSVFFIGRYTFDSKLLDDNRKISCDYDVTTGRVNVVYSNRPDLKMSFLSAHKSKGLQADYVFVINNKKGRMGFPSQIQDAPIINLLLDDCDDFPNAEERRLFYVAITRAKIKTFLVVVEGKESDFVLEVEQKYLKKLKEEKYICPLCGGKLIQRTGQYGVFWGCSNFKKTGCSYKRQMKRNT